MTPLDQWTDTSDPSWTLNVADDLKNQYTDQLTLNVEREVARNISVGASYIYKRAGNLFANIPINEVTGQDWEYERVPYTTSAGQHLNLYSVVLKDYDENGVVDGGDVDWISDHGTERVQNLPAFDGVKPKREYQAFQLVLNKRYADRWQGLASFLFSNSDGFSRRSWRQDFNVESPMFYDDVWMPNLNYAVNNLEGQLPFTPRFRAEAVWLVPDSACGDRPRRPLPDAQRPAGLAARRLPAAHGAGRPARQRDRPRGEPRVVSVDPNDPDHLPHQNLLDLHIGRAFKLGGGSQRVNFIVDGFNIFNTSTPLDIDVQADYGRVNSIPQSRRFRFGLRYEF
jgi:hypothetical protein